MLPLKINHKHLCQIFEPTKDFSSWSDADIQTYSENEYMLPAELLVTSETYARDAERTADYELESLVLVNRKAKVEVTWSLLRADYAEALMQELEYNYNFKNNNDEVIPVNAPELLITYRDFVGMRTINAYLGQTIDGTLVEHAGVQYWQDFRLAFPER